MCDTRFSIYLYSVRFGIRTCAGGYVSLGFSVVGVFMRVFGIGFLSRCDTSAVSFVSLLFRNRFLAESGVKFKRRLRKRF